MHRRLVAQYNIVDNQHCRRMPKRYYVLTDLSKLNPPILTALFISMQNFINKKRTNVQNGDYK